MMRDECSHTDSHTEGEAERKTCRTDTLTEENTLGHKRTQRQTHTLTQARAR